MAGWNKLKANLDKTCGITNWTLHDLRRTFATIHARIGTPPHIVEMLLNHKTSEHMTPIAKIYNRYTFEKEKRAAMEAYEAELTRILEKEYA